MWENSVSFGTCFNVCVEFCFCLYNLFNKFMFFAVFFVYKYSHNSNSSYKQIFGLTRPNCRSNIWRRRPTLIYSAEVNIMKTIEGEIVSILIMLQICVVTIAFFVWVYSRLNVQSPSLCSLVSSISWTCYTPQRQLIECKQYFFEIYV